MLADDGLARNGHSRCHHVERSEPILVKGLFFRRTRSENTLNIIARFVIKIVLQNPLIEILHKTKLASNLMNLNKLVPANFLNKCYRSRLSFFSADSYCITKSSFQKICHKNVGLWWRVFSTKMMQADSEQNLMSR